jgi:hypothetical protein
MAKNEKKSFVKGAFILGAAGLICKIFGAFFRIPMYNMLGDRQCSTSKRSFRITHTAGHQLRAGLPTAIPAWLTSIRSGRYGGAKEGISKSLIMLVIIARSQRLSVY